MNVKFLVWQIAIIASILITLYFGLIIAPIVIGAFELLILYIKFRKKEQDQYVLPATAARIMKATPQQMQHEMTILSTFLMIIGSIAFGVYSVFFLQAALFMKILIVFNAIGMSMLMLSQLITSYQQYIALMETQRIISSMGTQNITLMKGGNTNGSKKIS